LDSYWHSLLGLIHVQLSTRLSFDSAINWHSVLSLVGILSEEGDVLTQSNVKEVRLSADFGFSSMRASQNKNLQHCMNTS
jgi:hypothetical protein